MRYDKPIFFQRSIPGDYNALSGNYDADKTEEVKRYANVTDTGTDALKLIYGTIKQGCLTVRLQRPYEAPFDKIRVGEKLYNVDFERHKTAFIISEVQ